MSQKEIKKGLSYFAQNSAFQHLTKIGQTSKLDVEDRGLSASNVPEDFEYLAIFQCDDINLIEKKVHKQFEEFRHLSKSGRKTEFFWSGCINDAIKYTNDLKGVKNIQEEELEQIEIATSQITNKNNIQELENEIHKPKKVMRPRTTFEMIGIAVGTEIYFQNDKRFVAIVADDKNQITYNGKTGSISNIAMEIYKEKYIDKASLKDNKFFENGIGGFNWFYKDNQKLFSMRPDAPTK